MPRRAICRMDGSHSRSVYMMSAPRAKYPLSASGLCSRTGACIPNENVRNTTQPVEIWLLWCYVGDQISIWDQESSPRRALPGRLLRDEAVRRRRQNSIRVRYPPQIKIYVILYRRTFLGVYIETFRSPYWTRQSERIRSQNLLPIL